MIGNITDSSACRQCPAGYHAPNKFSFSCNACLEGKYGVAVERRSTKFQSSACQNCPVGFSNSEIAQSSCRACHPGYYVGRKGSPHCTACSRGRFSHDQASSCTWCPSGFYAFDFKSTECEACGYGQFQPLQEQTICNGLTCNTRSAAINDVQILLAKEFSVRESTSKYPVNISWMFTESMSSYFGSLMAEPLESIQWLVEMSTVESALIDRCIVPAGSKGEQFGLDVFEGATILWETKKFLTTLDRQSLSMHVDTDPHATALHVRVTLQNTRARSEGTAISSLITKKWKVSRSCQVGSEYLFAADEINSTDFTNPMQWSCRSCPVGADCVTCEKEKRGVYFPVAVDYDGIVPLSGWQTDFDDRGMFHKCKNSRACIVGMFCGINGTHSSNLNCTRAASSCDEAAGYQQTCRDKMTGKQRPCRLCSSCREGYARSSPYTCAPCPEGRAAELFFALAMFAAVAGMCAMITVQLSNGDARNECVSDAIQKIIVNWLQIVSIAAAFPLKWGPQLEGMFATFAFVSTGGTTNLLSIGCLLNSGATSSGGNVLRYNEADEFYVQQVAWVLFPLVVIVVIPLVWLIVARCCRKCCIKSATSKSFRRNLHEASANTSGGGLASKMDQVISEAHQHGNRLGKNKSKHRCKNFLMRCCGMSKAEVNWFIDRASLSLVVVLFLIYPSLTGTAARLIACVPIESTFYLQASLEEACFEGRHLFFLLAVGIPMLCLWILGIPSMAMLVLRSRRDKLFVPFSQTRYRYGILYNGYSPERYWYEFVILMRKVCFVFVAMTSFSSGLLIQTYLGTGLLVFAIYLHIVMQPFGVPGTDTYRERQGELLNRLELMSMFSALTTLWAGLLLQILANSAVATAEGNAPVADSMFAKCATMDMQQSNHHNMTEESDAIASDVGGTAPILVFLTVSIFVVDVAFLVYGLIHLVREVIHESEGASSFLDRCCPKTSRKLAHISTKVALDHDVQRYKRRSMAVLEEAAATAVVRAQRNKDLEKKSGMEMEMISIKLEGGVADVPDKEDDVEKEAKDQNSRSRRKSRRKSMMEAETAVEI